MKAVILAGGLGTRLSEETELKPKPMVEIGGKPILWHIMKQLSCHGINEFVIALGYKGYVIKRYFMDYVRLNSDCTVQLSSGEIQRRGSCEENWTVHLVDTGRDTQTGGRLKRLAEHIGDQPFLMTYGDGVANVNIPALTQFHHKHGKLATVTAVRPPARFGAIELDGDLVTAFNEKPQTGEGWINGGFFVLDPQVLQYISGDPTAWEREPVDRLVREQQMLLYRHHDFWQCMDTIRELRLLQELWDGNRAPWKEWV